MPQAKCWDSGFLQPAAEPEPCTTQGIVCLGQQWQRVCPCLTSLNHTEAKDRNLGGSEGVIYQPMAKTLSHHNVGQCENTAEIQLARLPGHPLRNSTRWFLSLHPKDQEKLNGKLQGGRSHLGATDLRVRLPSSP